MPKQRKRDGVYWRGDRREWWVSYVDASGKRTREAAPDADNHEQATVYREDRRREVREQRNLKPGEVLACLDTFEQVADRFLEHQKPRITPKAYQREESIVAHLKGFFTGKLAEVTSAQVSEYVTKRLAEVSRGTAKKELISLKHLFRLACGEWKLLPRFANPCLDVQAPEVRDERKQHLAPEQFRRVLAASPEWLQPIVGLLTATGMRRGELLGCQWGFIKGTRIYLPISKNGDAKEVALNKYALQVLATLPPGNPTDLLFPGITPEQVSMAFHRVCTVLKIADVRLHDLRHTFATWLRQRGTELDVIAGQLGHRDLRMTRRYARVASTQVEDAVNGLDSTLGDFVSHPIVTTKQLTEGEKPVIH